MKPDFAFGSFGFEIGCYVTNSQGHDQPQIVTASVSSIVVCGDVKEPLKKARMPGKVELAPTGMAAGGADIRFGSLADKPLGLSFKRLSWTDQTACLNASCAVWLARSNAPRVSVNAVTIADHDCLPASLIFLSFFSATAASASICLRAASISLRRPAANSLPTVRRFSAASRHAFT